MKNLYKEELKMVLNLALEFRLSLKNICLFFNAQPTDNNQLLFYNEIIKNAGNLEKIDEFKYLIYETACESDRDYKVPLSLAKLFYKKYAIALNNYRNDETKKGQYELALSNINHTDIEFKKIVSKGFQSITEKDATIIAKYRIKHVISKMEFAKEFYISRDTVTRWESLITDARLQEKIRILNDYNHNLGTIYYKSSNKRK